MSELQRRLTSALGDRYTIEGRLGTGATAVVLLARDLKHDRQVALKVLRPEFAQSLGTERFLREIRLVAGFTHPHILPLHDSGEADGLLYYTMPLARGGSLRTRLAQERQLPVTDAVRIAFQVASALAYAHARGVVHRDIKPENILLEEGQVLLADFGLARGNAEATATQITDPGLAVGTPIYMSPEQAAGMTVDGRSDVYALGCVLFEMLDGEPPFTGRSADIVLARHRTEAPRGLDVSRPGLPLPLKQAVVRALAKVPADRFSSASAFADAIRAASDGVLSTPGGIPAAAPVQPRRWREVATALAVLAIPAAIVARGFSAKAEAPLEKDVRDPRRVAVMYFTAPDASRSIADGVTEELVDNLSGVSALSVISTDGVRSLKGQALSPDSVAHVFGVGTIVSGSVRTERDSVYATVRLVDGNDGHQLGSLTVAQPRTRVGSLSERLASRVAEELRGRIGANLADATRRQTSRDGLAWEFSKEAQSLQNDASALLRDGQPGRAVLLLARADSLLERAADRDPKWSEPWVSRAWVRLRSAYMVLQGRSARAWPSVDLETGRAIGFANRALELAIDSSAALEVRGVASFVRWRGRGDERDLREAEQDLLRATALKPAFASAWRFLAELYFESGRSGEASVAGRHAVAADAFLSEEDAVVALLVDASLDSERFDEARTWCEQGIERYRTNPSFLDCRLKILSRYGKGLAAIDSARRFLAEAEAKTPPPMLAVSGPYHKLWLALVLARSGNGMQAREVMRQALDTLPTAQRKRLGAQQASVEVVLGDADAAVGRLADYFAQFPQTKALYANSPLFRDLRDNDRFRALLRADP